MGSTFKGMDLFGSGPHRFSVGKEGLFTATNTEIQGTPTPGTTELGLLELEVQVAGRLVAESESALWSLRDAITAELSSPAVAGTLIDHHGRTWTDMTFVRFDPADRTDRGRRVSLGYRATFRRFLDAVPP